MSKKWFVVILVVLVLSALGFAGIAYAQTQPPTPTPCLADCPNTLEDGVWGMYTRPGRGDSHWGNGTRYWSDQGGFLHEEMLQAFGSALNMTKEALQARLDAGDSLDALAQEAGMSSEQFIDLMLQTRQSAIQSALANGILSPEQAEWMLDRMEQLGSAMDNLGEWHFGFGACQTGVRGKGGFGGGMRGYNR